MPKPSDVLILSIKLESGQFDMSLKFPIVEGATEADFRSSVEAWLDSLSVGLVVGGKERAGRTRLRPVRRPAGSGRA